MSRPSVFACIETAIPAGVSETVHDQWADRGVTLICGPVGSGKSTLARTLHANVLELEGVSDLAAFARTEARIGADLSPDWAVVSCAPTAADRARHEARCRPARTLVLLTPPDVCHERIETRHRPRLSSQHAAADHWWRLWKDEHP